MVLKIGSLVGGGVEAFVELGVLLWRVPPNKFDAVDVRHDDLEVLL